MSARQEFDCLYVSGYSDETKFILKLAQCFSNEGLSSRIEPMTIDETKLKVLCNDVQRSL